MTYEETLNKMIMLSDKYDITKEEVLQLAKLALYFCDNCPKEWSDKEGKAASVAMYTLAIYPKKFGSKVYETVKPAFDALMKQLLIRNLMII